MKLILETTQKEVDIVKVLLTRLINESKAQSDALKKWDINPVDLARLERFRDTLRAATLTE